MSDDIEVWLGGLPPAQRGAIDDDRVFRAIVLTRLNELNGRVTKSEDRADDHHTRITRVEERATTFGLVASAAGAVTGFFTGLFSK